MINQLIKPFAHLVPENNRFERIWLLAKFDFLKRYYGSFLGLVWALINPLSQLIIYYFVFTIIFEKSTPNYAMFLFLGIVIYFFFTESTNKSIMLINSKRYILENIQINKMDIYYAAIISTFIAFLFNLLVCIIASLILGITYTCASLYFILLVFNLLIFVMAVMLILSIIYVYVRDIQHFWSIFTMLLFWASGIVFVIEPAQSMMMKLLAYITPLAGIMINTRAVLIYNEAINWNLFWYDFAYSLVLIGIALLIFKKYSLKTLEIL